MVVILSMNSPVKLIYLTKSTVENLFPKTVSDDLIVIRVEFKKRKGMLKTMECDITPREETAC